MGLVGQPVLVLQIAWFYQVFAVVVLAHVVVGSGSLELLAGRVWP